MIKSYITIALRKLSREKLYVSINIFSLALGIASFLILALYLRSELTYDQHHVNHERIYRMTAHFTSRDGRVDRFAPSPIGFGPLFVGDYPQIGKHVRFKPAQENVLRYQNIEKKWENIFLADPTVFEVFTHKVLYGDIKTAFDSPKSVALSETAAKYYFGDENPIGKTLAGGSMTFNVSLVFADLPENTHFKYDVLYPMSLMEIFDPSFTKNYQRSLFGVGGFTYFMVPEGFELAELDTLTKKFVEQRMGPTLKFVRGSFEARYQPLADVHFGEKLEGDQPSGYIFYVYGFMAVAMFVLLVACINYMNLATARATKRAKEVGMRKVLGASQRQLVTQFLGESFTFTAAALVLALVLVELALTPIGGLMGKERLLGAMAEPTAIVGAVGVGVVVALLAGLYPAFYLSSISPLAALTQVKRSWRMGFSMRQALVLSQLAISVAVIACTFLMTDQMRYIHEKPLGFDSKNRLLIDLRGYDVVKSIKTLKTELRKQPYVLDATTIFHVPGTGSYQGPITVETNEGTFDSMATDDLSIGLNFVQAMNLKLIEGRGFSEDIATDAREAVLVNESFVKNMGWSQALGKRFQVGSRNDPRYERVVGVVQDFHYGSLHNRIGPMIMRPMNDELGDVPDIQKPLVSSSIVVVLSGENLRAAIDNVQNVIAKFDPNFKFEPRFLEDRLDDQYKAESNLMKLTAIFAGICIFISIMGLFGLTAFTTEQRTKEIGIRKVLGASDGQIIALLIRHLLPLVAIAVVPASILSYYAIDKWLQRFAYRADIGWGAFVLATLLVTAVALTTVVLHSLKTARSEPVDALRYA